jgi:FkbM family methyltransferase
MRGTAKKLALRLMPDAVLQLAKKVHYASFLRHVRQDDEPDLLVLERLIQAGQSVADIGANIGLYTKFLSEYVGPTGRVVSIEPIPLTFDILRWNVRRLKLRNVEVRNLAVSSAVRQLRMDVPRYDSGGDNFYEAHVACSEHRSSDGRSRSFVVQSTTVDAQFSRTQPLHFIKCDVEGHELDCIKGATQTIERFMPAWLIEVSGEMSKRGSSGAETRDILQRHGYRPYWLDGTLLRVWKPSAPRSVNYFFLAPPHIETLRRRALQVEA